MTGMFYAVMIRKGTMDIPNKAIEHKFAELDWLRINSSKYIVYGVTSVDDMYERLKAVLNDGDTFIVLAMTGNWKGFTSKTVIDWLKKPRS